MRVFSNLANRSSKLRVFISSRHDEDILRYFKGTPVMEMQAIDNEEDISSFVEDRLFRDTRWTDISPEFQEEVKLVFHEKSQGMFQWAALQVDQIRRLKLWSEANIRRQLDTSPTGLKAAYDVVWNQMREMSSYEQQLARRALQWVLCAFVPLEMRDLSHVMQIEPNTGTVEGDTVFEEKAIQSICGNLLVCDRQSNVWRFSHLSAREYIERHHYSMLESHNHVAISSIKFLQQDLIYYPSFSRIDMIPVTSLLVFARSQSHPNGPSVTFTVSCRYIVEHVFRHAHEVDLPKFRHSELSNLLRNFFEPISQGSSFFKTWKSLLLVGGSSRDLTIRDTVLDTYPLEISSTPLQVMSIYGLFDILRDLWVDAGAELDVCDMWTPSPLTLAIAYGHESLWKFILFANSKVNNGVPGPLTAAMELENMKAFEALLEAGADVNYVHPDVHPDYGFLVNRKKLDTVSADIPLRAALWLSRKQRRRYFVQRLLDRGADINQRSRARTTLQLAVEEIDEEAVRILLDANAEMHSPDHLLRLSAQNKEFNLVPFFVKLGANIEEPWQGVLPLVWALREGNLANVASLLEMSDARMDLSHKQHREAILSAVSRCGGWYISAFLFVFSAYININWGDVEITYILGRSITSYPIFECELEGLGFCKPQDPLSSEEAAAHRRSRLIESLIDAGPDPYLTVDLGFGGTLTLATFHGRLHHFRALLNHEEAYWGESSPLYRAVLFAMLSGQLSILSKKSPENWWKPFSNETRCPSHLEVLRLLFEKPLGVYFPIYNLLDSLIPVVQINPEGYEVSEPCRMYLKGYYTYFSLFWLLIMWHLQNATSPQLPLRSQLRRWRFPGTLPPRLTIVAKVAALSGAWPNHFIKLSFCGHHSQFSFVPASMEVRRSSGKGSEDKRWKRYKPEIFGVIRCSVPDSGVELSNSEVVGASSKFEVYLGSLLGNSMAWIFLPLIAGLFWCFVVIRLSSRET